MDGWLGWVAVCLSAGTHECLRHARSADIGSGCVSEPQSRRGAIEPSGVRQSTADSWPSGPLRTVPAAARLWSYQHCHRLHEQKRTKVRTDKFD